MITAAVARELWLVAGIQGGPAPADLDRLAALVATRDAIRHARPALALNRDFALAVMRRLAADWTVPPDLRGAALGFGWSLSRPGNASGTEAVRAACGAAAPDTLGDWLAGLFALAREEILAIDDLLGVLDELIGAMPERDFLVGLPALRQAFAFFFPPREREGIAHGVLARWAPAEPRAGRRPTSRPAAAAQRRGCRRC